MVTPASADRSIPTIRGIGSRAVRAGTGKSENGEQGTGGQHQNRIGHRRFRAAHIGDREVERAVARVRFSEESIRRPTPCTVGLIPWDTTRQRLRRAVDRRAVIPLGLGAPRTY